jgi:hypothetical protein
VEKEENKEEEPRRIKRSERRRRRWKVKKNELTDSILSSPS